MTDNILTTANQKKAFATLVGVNFLVFLVIIFSSAVVKPMQLLSLQIIESAVVLFLLYKGKNWNILLLLYSLYMVYRMVFLVSPGSNLIQYVILLGSSILMLFLSISLTLSYFSTRRKVKAT